MRPKTRNLARFFTVTLAVLLALPSLYHFNQTMAGGSAQNKSRSDVQLTKKRTNKPAVPHVINVAPSNDNCANAISVTPANCPFTDTKDTTDATDEIGEPESTCTLQAASVWYTFTNTGSDREVVSINTCASDFDTALMVYLVNPAQPCNFASFTPVACSDDSPGCGDGFQSVVSFTANAGEVFKIQAGGFDGETGSLGISINCESVVCDDIVINGTLGSGDPAFGGTQAHGNQLGRLNRNGVSSTCDSPKTCDIFDPAGLRAFDSYAIPNESGEDACVSVTLNVTTQDACNLQSNAYLNSYNPNSICTNYLADPGLSSGTPPTPTNFSFVVPAGQTLILVVHTTNPGETGCNYTLTVTGNLCEQFDFCVQSDFDARQFIKINSTTGAYEFHDCSKGITLTGIGTVTTSFCKIELHDRGPDPKRSDRAVDVLVNPCTSGGSASVRTSPGGKAVTISDSNILNNTCECP